MAKLQFLLFISLALVASIAGATQYKVGGSKGWSVPSDPQECSQWAHKNRFKIGDSLVFVYLPDQDSVLLVDANSYSNCNTSSFIDQFDDGNTVFTFTRSGPFYFISGNKDNCLKNESLVVVVLADRSNRSSPVPAPSPAASSPPPPGTVEVVPTSPPEGEGATTPPPPPNGASFMAVSLMGTVGALLLSVCFAL